MTKRVLIITNNFHHKNRHGLEILLKHLNYHFDYYTNETKLENYDIIYSPCHPIDAAQYPKQKFIFGPHFSVFPDPRITQINAKVHNNAVYIQPSEWARSAWTSLGVEQFIPLKTFWFPVDTNMFEPKPHIERNGPVVVYYKRRKPEELKLVISELHKQNIKYKIFSYTKGYKENEYLQALQKAPYGIWIDAHESQGFATLEALACDVPLLVWNVQNMNQEEGANHPSVPATSVPYWNEKCGEVFHQTEEFVNKLNILQQNIHLFKPRDYILNYLSVHEIAKRFNNIYNTLTSI